MTFRRENSQVHEVSVPTKGATVRCTTSPKPVLETDEPHYCNEDRVITQCRLL